MAKLLSALLVALWAATLGPAMHTSVGVAPAVAIAPASACRADLWARVYHPARLEVAAPCVRVTGVIVDATHGRESDGVRHEADGDTHGWLQLDAPFASMLDAGNVQDEGGNLVFEVICHFRASQLDAIAACRGADGAPNPPPVGTHVAVTGVYVQDTNHGRWMEIHPVSRFEVMR